MEFVALDYTNPSKNQHAYKLDGFDKDWVYCGTRRYASYTNLDPGEYIFKVKGSNNDGVWNEAGTSVKIIITPPYWQTWWFRGLIISMVLLCLTFFTYNLKRKEKKKAEIEKKISELKLQALRAQMKPHFLFNVINSIQYLISSNDQKSAYNYLSKFSKLMRITLENAEKSTIQISNELEGLKLYLELESLRFEDKFCYNIDIDPEIDIHNVEIPTMLIQPYVENAIHHGLRHKSSKGELNIKLELQNSRVVCSIQDNGIGIEKALALRNKQNDNHHSTGMKVSHERLEILNTINKNGNVVEVSDLAKNGNRSSGTLVKIHIPIEM